MFRFLHAADIHLDSPLRGLQSYPGAPVTAIRQASRQALVNLVELALREKVAFVLLAGDLYDGDWRDYNTGLFFVQQMAKLHDAKIPVFAIAGNHDAANKMTRALALPDSVKMLSVHQAETATVPGYDVQIHGQGFADARVTDDLSQGYPGASRGLFNIGLLHTCATGADDHERYAPCTIEGLRSKGYDYWALGHIHKRSILCHDPLIVFPGNIQGRHIRETGEKGCMLVQVDDAGQPRVEFRTLDVFRWELLSVRADEEADADAVLGNVRDAVRQCRERHDLPLGVRVQIAGATGAHPQLAADTERWTNQIRSWAVEDHAEQVWIEKVEWRTKPLAAVGAAEDDGPLAEITQIIGELRRDTQFWSALLSQCDELKQLASKLPKDQPEFSEALRLNDPAIGEEVLVQVEAILNACLLKREDDA